MESLRRFYNYSDRVAIWRLKYCILLQTGLSYLASHGPVSLLEAFLSLEGVDVNKPDNEGNTPLHFAAQAGNPISRYLFHLQFSFINIE